MGSVARAEALSHKENNMTMTAEQIVAEIQDLYRSDSMPWIVGYSGGKDSTASLQLVWTALLRLPPEERTKMVYVISTDTLVENPVIAGWVQTSLLRIDVAAKQQGLNIKAERLTPAMGNRFWVNLIGKGYPAPRPKFRWCTDRLKISTSTEFIQKLSESQGEAILVLGQRRGESQARDKVMDQYKGSTRDRLSKNKDPKLSRVWVYPPIESWTSDDVWEYLITTPNPWGLDNQELFNIYRGATPDAECPIVVDTSTSSCGDSRFGCYVCTMVSQDKSMQAMIQNDDQKQWMQPILDFRNKNLAVEDRDDRDFRRLNGRLTLFRDQLVHGPYTQQRRAFLLRELLQTQKLVQESDHKQGTQLIELISVDELDEIRRIWVEEKGEIEDLVPKIYADALGVAYPGRDLEQVPLDRGDLAILQQVSTEVETETEAAQELYKLTRSLLALQFQSIESHKRSKHLDRLEGVLRQYAFRNEQEALEFAKSSATNEPDPDGDVSDGTTMIA
ncbi:MAG TPA: DNA phosphorothioation system sulfurtransferase DndC [Thiomonas arsenitoxydans]|uniref:DNA phosphorothioation system sulfurtransferase DndC n=1 Tax=Thiomonas arsenitoxydans (strain DSM 22701 / CIP 110005 / 3As) TaxID=426114 RepID=UPI002D0A41FC|nr:DNA phosphorothioation system sulfurtransferase DndC [Thiomonas arsenitoxydans]HML83382.1 DNA phosphorothioation system sulfurtransferase DndC [Thiomonas arsenitoxydans]